MLDDNRDQGFDHLLPDVGEPAAYVGQTGCDSIFDLCTL